MIDNAKPHALPRQAKTRRRETSGGVCYLGLRGPSGACADGTAEQDMQPPGGSFLPQTCHLGVRQKVPLRGNQLIKTVVRAAAIAAAFFISFAGIASAQQDAAPPQIALTDQQVQGFITA